MKKIFISVALIILLTNFIFAGITGSTITGSAVDGDDEEGKNIASQTRNDNQKRTEKTEEVSRENMQRKLTQERIRNIVKSNNKLRAQQGEECPENCVCTGSATKCEIDGRREMTITAGKSGNIIFQVKGINASTKVELYKENGKIYGNFKNNRTRKINLLPDQIKEKIRHRIKAKLESQEAELNDDGNYQIEARKRARFFGFIPVKEKVKVEINSETGEIIKTKISWWGFLARDVQDDEVVVGENCGTVTPGENDLCCANKGYDYWNSEKSECLFYEEEIED